MLPLTAVVWLLLLSAVLAVFVLAVCVIVLASPAPPVAALDADELLKAEEEAEEAVELPAVAVVPFVPPPLTVTVAVMPGEAVELPAVAVVPFVLPVTVTVAVMPASPVAAELLDAEDVGAEK